MAFYSNSAGSHDLNPSSIPQQLSSYNSQVANWEDYISGIADLPSDSFISIDQKMKEIFRQTQELYQRSLDTMRFVPEKLGKFRSSFDPFFERWKWTMHDLQFQDPFYQFFSSLKIFTEKSFLSDDDISKLQTLFNKLPEVEKIKIHQRVQNYPIGFISSLDSSSFRLSDSGWQQLFIDLKDSYLREKVEALSDLHREYLAQEVEKKALQEGVVIEDWDLEWRLYHLYDSPERLTWAFVQLSLLQRNERLFELWKQIKQVSSYHIAAQLLNQSPLLDDFRRGGVLEITGNIQNELIQRAKFLNEFIQTKRDLAARYSNLKIALENPSDPLYKEMQEKFMHVVLSQNLLFTPSSSSSSSSVSSSEEIAYLEEYFTLIRELIHSDGLSKADAQYLFRVINRRYALHPDARLITDAQQHNELICIAKKALRRKELKPKEGFTRIKGEAEYQSIYELKKADEIIGKFKPLPLDSLKKEKYCAAFNVILGTDFTPKTQGVFLSIRDDLLQIRSLIEKDQHHEAMQLLDQLHIEIRQELYYLMFFRIKPESRFDDCGNVGWHDESNTLANIEDRMAVIDRFLDPVWQLEKIKLELQFGNKEIAAKEFRMLNRHIQESVFFQLYSLKGQENPLENFGELAWEGTIDGVNDMDRIEAIERSMQCSYSELASLSANPQRLHLAGTLQNWVPGCMTAHQMLYYDRLGGKKVRDLPDSLIQMYNILNIIKGAGDCHPGNTLVQLDNKGQIVNLIDCDDEFSLPDSNNFNQTQIWSLGLPQAAKPLLRPIVCILAQEKFTEDFKRYIEFHEPERSSSIQALYERLDRIKKMCQSELQQPSISLTCRDLYLELYDAKDRYEELLQTEGHHPKMILFNYFMHQRIRNWVAEVDQGLVDFLMHSSIFKNNINELESST